MFDGFHGDHPAGCSAITGRNYTLELPGSLQSCLRNKVSLCSNMSAVLHCISRGGVSLKNVEKVRLVSFNICLIYPCEELLAGEEFF